MSCQTFVLLGAMEEPSSLAFLGAGWSLEWGGEQGAGKQGQMCNARGWLSPGPWKICVSFKLVNVILRATWSRQVSSKRRGTSPPWSSSPKPRVLPAGAAFLCGDKKIRFLAFSSFHRPRHSLACGLSIFKTSSSVTFSATSDSPDSLSLYRGLCDYIWGHLNHPE